MNSKVILYILIFVVITAILGYYFKSKDCDFVEDFSNYNQYEIKENLIKIYDRFYSNIYNKLFGSELKNEFEIYNIKEYTNKDFSKNEQKYLDLGCGIGDHLKILSKDKLTCVGVDNSIKMLEKARDTNPEVPLINGDFHNKKLFKNREFTHIYCLFFTIYYSQNPEKIFKNVNYIRLKPRRILLSPSC